MGEQTRPIGWIRASRKAYEAFPQPVRDRVNTALTIAAVGGKADIAMSLRRRALAPLDRVLMRAPPRDATRRSARRAVARSGPLRGPAP